MGEVCAMNKLMLPIPNALGVFSMDTLAQRNLIGTSKTDKSKIKIIVKLGTPSWIDENTAECERAIEGLYEKLMPARGCDLFQSLELAIKSINALIDKKRADYDLTWEDDGSDYL